MTEILGSVVPTTRVFSSFLHFLLGYPEMDFSNEGSNVYRSLRRTLIQRMNSLSPILSIETLHLFTLLLDLAPLHPIIADILIRSNLEKKLHLVNCTPNDSDPFTPRKSNNSSFPTSPALPKCTPDREAEFLSPFFDAMSRPPEEPLPGLNLTDCSYTRYRMDAAQAAVRLIAMNTVDSNEQIKTENKTPADTDHSQTEQDSVQDGQTEEFREGIFMKTLLDRFITNFFFKALKAL